jgi:hypothetical protein
LALPDAAWSSTELLDHIDVRAAESLPGVTTRGTRQRHRGPWIAAAAAVAVLVPIVLVAAVMNGQREGNVAESPSTTAEVPVTPETSAIPPVMVTAVDYGFRGIPAVVPLGASFDFHNASTDEYHTMYVLRLPSGDDRTAEEFQALELAEIVDSEATPRFGTFIGMMGAFPGEEASFFVGRDRVSEPGRYLVFGFGLVDLAPDIAAARFEVLPDGHLVMHSAPTGESEYLTPHYRVGAFAEFIVEP